MFSQTNTYVTVSISLPIISVKAVSPVKSQVISGVCMLLHEEACMHIIISMMTYRKLGKTGTQVSAVGLGTFQFGGSWGVEFSEADVQAIFAEAEVQGINFIDTAECYGVGHYSEQLVGSVIQGNRDKWILATKFGHKRIEKKTNVGAWSADEVRQQLEESLRALRTDYVDLYQFHSGSNDDYDNDELWTMLDKQVRDGKIRFLGASLSRKDPAWVTYQTRKAPEKGISVLQVRYNMLEQDVDQDFFAFCTSNDIGIIARVPMASGMLSGKYQELTSFDPEDTRAKKYDAQTIKKFQKEVQHIIDHQLPAGMDMPTYALAWVLANPAVTTVIPGCKSPEHVRKNAEAAAVTLPG